MVSTHQSILAALQAAGDKSDATAILQEAAAIVAGVRSATHGPKERSFNAIGRLWTAYLGARKEGVTAPISAADVAHLMVLLKIARAVQGEWLRDHAIDAAGYAAIAGELGAKHEADHDE